MKKFVMITTFILALPVFAGTVIEFDEKQELACYQEIQKIGCTDQQGEQKNACVNQKIKSLSPDCQSLFRAKNSAQ